MARSMGWRREGSKRRFRYLDAAGRPITDEAKLERISALAIPPAWKDVWIAPTARSKLQATGVDAAGRKQYLYHPEFRARQEQAKYDKLIRFAERLPQLREAMAEHMELEGLPPERVAAIAVRLINLGWFRVGTDRYAKASRTFGITTLAKRHVTVRGSRISFKYRGKHQVMIRSAIVDPELAAAMRELLAVPGARVFQFEADGRFCNLESRRLNDYIREYMGEEFTAKDFRTWGGTLTAALELAEKGLEDNPNRIEEGDRRRDAEGRGEARQHTRRRALVVRQPGGRRAVSRRENGRGFPAPSFASRRRTRHRSRRRGDGDAEPAALVAHSLVACGGLISD